MNQPLRIASSLLVIYGMILAGYLARRRRPALLGASPRIFRLCLFCGDCPMMVVIFWMLSPEQRAGAWQLPLIGLALSTMLIGVGILMARSLRLSRMETGAFVCGSSMSNIGYSFGGILCLMIFGLDGITLSQTYTLYLTPFTFLIMFQVAASYASAQAAATLRGMTARFLEDPARWLPLLAIAIGILLNRFAPRPGKWIEPVITSWVLAATAVYSFGIGTSIRLGKLREHLRPCLALAGVKFLITPLLALVLVLLCHLTPLQRQVVFVESAMPMAIWALVLTGLTGLSRDLANSCWMFTTLLALPLTLPLYWIATKVIAR